MLAGKRDKSTWSWVLQNHLQPPNWGQLEVPLSVGALGAVALSQLGPHEAPSSLPTARLTVPHYSYNLILGRPSRISFTMSQHLPRLVGFKPKIRQSRGRLLSCPVPVSVLEVRLCSGFSSSRVTTSRRFQVTAFSEMQAAVRWCGY